MSAKKVCAGPCGRELTLIHFGCNDRQPDGLQRWCRECCGGAAEERRRQERTTKHATNWQIQSWAERTSRQHLEAP